MPAVPRPVSGEADRLEPFVRAFAATLALLFDAYANPESEEIHAK
jgi:hypothetical protein